MDTEFTIRQMDVVVKVVTEPRMCVPEDDVWKVDEYTDADGRTHRLLWDLENDTMGIGFNFIDSIPRPSYEGGALMAYDHIDVMPDKRTAMQAWLDLTRED